MAFDAARWCSGSGADDGINRLSLRFEDPGREKGYADSRKKELSRCIVILSTAVLTVFVLLAVSTHGFWAPDQWDTDAQREMARLQALMMSTGVVVFLFVLLTARALAKCDYIGTFGLEIVIVATSACTMIPVAVFPKHYIARVLGYSDTEGVWGMELGGTDGNFLIFLDACLTTLHLLVPIRWVMLIPLEVCAVFIYAVPAYVLGSPDMRMVPANIVGLLGLVILSALGKRGSERQERTLFAGFLTEKRMRFQAEYQLSEQKNRDLQVEDTCSARGSGSGRGSRPETSLNGQAFHVEHGGDLSAIYDVGEKEQWLIRNTEVELVPNGHLGEGGFGTVTKALYHNTLVALKVPKADVLQKSGQMSKNLMELCNELRILRRLRHPNIVFLYGACVDQNFEKLCLVLEFVNGTPLGAFVRSLGGSCGDDDVCTWGGADCRAVRIKLISDILNALRFLHSRRPAVVHGDLKDENVFVEDPRVGGGRSEYTAKLLDFGLSRIITRSAKPLGGTVRWMAPELLSRDRVPPDTTADVYSFGQLLYFLTVGVPPFCENPASWVLKYLRRGMVPSLTWPPECDDLAQSCRELVLQCTQRGPALRPTTQQVSDEFRGLAGDSDSLWTGPSSEGPPGVCATDPQVGNAGHPTSGTFEAFPDGAALAMPPEEFHGLVQMQQPGRGSGIGTRARHCGGLSPLQENEELQPTPTAGPAGPPVGDRQKSPGREVAAEALLHPHLEVTPFPTQRDSLAFLLTQWNYSTSGGSCCWLHESLSALGRVHREMRGLRCRRLDVREIVSGQCRICKLLLTHGQSRCDFCESPEGSSEQAGGSQKALSTPMSASGDGSRSL